MPAGNACGARCDRVDRHSLTFTDRVRARFGGRAAAYGRHAPLQRAVAWRLARAVAPLPLPPGPAADLGAGTGLLGQALLHPALQQQRPQPERARPLLQLDLCPELLAHNPLAASHGSQVWDLNTGLPEELAGGAALLCSSFALQWLEQPAAHLERWCRALAPGGWLAVAVPTAASFPQWRLAAARAGVPYTGLALPTADALAAVAAAALQLRQGQRLRYTHAAAGGRPFLRSLQAIGASASPGPPRPAGELRRLLQHWPSDAGITWEVLLLIGQRPS